MNILLIGKKRKAFWSTYNYGIFNENVMMLLCGGCHNHISYEDFIEKKCNNCLCDIEYPNDLDLHFSPSGDFIIHNPFPEIKIKEQKYPVYGEELTLTEIKNRYPKIYIENFRQEIIKI